MPNRTLDFPPYDTVAEHEGKGNWAVSKYYRFPYRFFYRHKLRMITDLIGHETFAHLLDYGCGPGVLKRELEKHALYYKGYDLGDVFDPRWRFDVVVLASVLEFLNIESTLKRVKSVLKPSGFIIIASPMDTWASRQYFKLIGDKHTRNSNERIIGRVSDMFKVQRIDTWLGLYFAMKAMN